MTAKQKTALAKPTIFYPTVLFLSLGGIFILAPIFSPRSFYYLALMISVLLVHLFYLRSLLTNQIAAHQLHIQDIRERINMTGASIDNDSSAISSFEEKIQKYDQLKVLTEKLSACFTLENTAKVLSKEAGRLLGDKTTTMIFYLFHSQTGELNVFSFQKGEMRADTKSKRGDDFDQYLLKTMQSLLIEDIKSDYRFDLDKMKIEDERQVGSLMSTPMMVGNKPLGILRFDSPEKNRFTTEDLRFLTMVGDLGAVSIENAQLYERLEQMAVRDGLTGLYLRRYLDDRLREEIQRRARQKNDLSILMLDIDYFKKYNDTFGHVAGDIVLKTVGRILSEYFQEPGQLCVRYGGEEFLVCLPDCPKKIAAEAAENIRQLIAREDIFLRRKKTSITVSIGVASFLEDAEDKDALIQKADEALYKAKKKGRNRVCLT